MTLPAPATGERFLVNVCNHAVLDVIGRVRAAHEEIDPFLIESQDDGLPYDRRKSRRIQLRMPLILLPVERTLERADVVEVFGPEQLAMTRDISTLGLGVLHDEPIVTDYAVIQFDIPGEAPCRLLYEVRWTVRKTQFSYMTGGRLTAVVDPYVEESNPA
ncbi:MAG: hypothetical protein AB7U20_20020 [Planctomycetaceae bacterium]